jgi:hypothetical protein
VRVKKKETKVNSNGKILFIVGSFTIFTVAFLVIPKNLTKIAGFANKKLTKYSNEHNDGNWGPVYVEKNNNVERLEKK